MSRVQQSDIQHYLRPGTLQLASLPPLSVYVHLPWCLKKCPYCDFNSHEINLAPKTPAASAPQGGASGLGRPGTGWSAELPQQRYLDALQADLEAALPLVWGRSVHSVFIGGGTPSLFSPEGIDSLIASLRARLTLSADCEITLEANPGTFEKDRFKAYRAAGVTRLSVGVQSFNDAALQRLGRVHDRVQAIAAVEEAAQAFNTFNLDIMYALPDQTRQLLRQDMATALALAPPHISIYHLTIEPNTYFAKHPPAAVAEDEAYAMLDLLTELTGAAGLQRYEVSAYALPGHRCRHNLNYWQFGDYLGLGAGAHSKLSFAHRVVRQTRYREPRLYMEQALAGQSLAQEEEIGRADLCFEFMLNALRLKDGFALQQFCERTGQPITSIAAALDKAEQLGLLRRDLTRVAPTGKGYDFLNDLQELFLPASAKAS